jgi:hypothetical protein
VSQGEGGGEGQCFHKMEYSSGSGSSGGSSSSSSR